ncbi:hypothetical protein Tco_0265585 [Tanacetum coccineum]
MQNMSPKPLHLNLSQSTKKTVIQNSLRGTRKCKMNLAHLAKYFKRALQTYQQQPSILIKLQEQDEDTTPSITMTIIKGRLESKEPMTVAWYMGTMQKNSRSQSGVNRLRINKKDDDVQNRLNKATWAKIQEVSPEESSSTGHH